jgi:aspartyl-tRNA(Asn)/glutamyl-tRNA(Gln) amidotransferase subunit A
MKPEAGMSATAIVSGVHEGEFTAADVAAVHLDQINQYDEALRAFASVNQRLVRAQADWLDRQRDAGARLPLHGVPVAVKDIIDVAGLPTIAGFEPFRGNIARQDAAIVARLRSLGALMLGKTHTTQFAVGDPAPTRNPWNLEQSPAGSSAGSGVAVPAGMSPIALGSQTAGSVLRPAAFNGCIGFKPTWGWISMEGVLPLAWSLDHLGLYASTVEDLSLIYHSLLEQGPAQRRADKRPPRIGYLSEFSGMSQPAVAGHIQHVAEKAVEAGGSVVETRLPVSFEDLFSVHQVIFAAEMASVHIENVREHPEDYGPRIRDGVEAGALISAVDLMQAQRLQRRHIQTIDSWFGSFDALLMPTVSSEACDRAETGDRRFQVPATLLGLPAISLPTGMSQNGLPLGIQLIGRANRDDELLEVARWLTDVVPLIGRPPLEHCR